MKDLFHIPAARLRELGVVDWGYTTETVPRSAARFNDWLALNKESLPFLAQGRAAEFRQDLKVWWPEAQAALVFLFSYAPAKKALLAENDTRVAGYALGFDGLDYHPVMKARLATIAADLQAQVPFNWKHTHDTEPVLERDLAHRSGLGWFGKNAMHISRQHGSYHLIGGMVLDRALPLDVGTPVPDHCGSCRACVDACPTDAIDPVARTIIARQCISTWTIEERSMDVASPAGLEKARGEVFGCDICQDVCPWNHKALGAVGSSLGEGARRWRDFFRLSHGEIAGRLAWMTNRGYLRFTEGSPFGRPGRPALLRTLAFWMKRP